MSLLDHPPQPTREPSQRDQQEILAAVAPQLTADTFEIAQDRRVHPTASGVVRSGLLDEELAREPDDRFARRVRNTFSGRLEDIGVDPEVIGFRLVASELASNAFRHVLQKNPEESHIAAAGMVIHRKLGVVTLNVFDTEAASAERVHRQLVERELSQFTGVEDLLNGLDGDFDSVAFATLQEGTRVSREYAARRGSPDGEMLLGVHEVSSPLYGGVVLGKMASTCVIFDPELAAAANLYMPPDQVE